MSEIRSSDWPFVRETIAKFASGVVRASIDIATQNIKETPIRRPL
jgi:hypothetical protein